MLTYLSHFFSGEVDPFWPHIILLSVTVAASFAVGAGIIFEAPKYSESVHRIAVRLVIAGVVVEAACTIFLFVFDEGISSAQQSKIIALESRLAARSLSDDQAAEVAKRLKPFSTLTFQIIPYWENPDSLDIANRIAGVLASVGWKLENPERFTTLVGVITGIIVNVDKRASDTARNGAKELASALTENGIAAKVRETDDPTTNLPSERINMQVGIK
jgi:hypothetical protein